MDFVQGIIDNNGFPVFTAFLLGLIVALHPCPLAANVAAMGYIAKDAHCRRRVFINGLAYTLGRILAYSLLGLVLLAVFRGSGAVGMIGRWFSEWGERLLGPVLVAVGLYFILERFIHKHEHCPDVASAASGAALLWACCWHCLFAPRVQSCISGCSCRCRLALREAISCPWSLPWPRRFLPSSWRGPWLTA